MNLRSWSRLSRKFSARPRHETNGNGCQADQSAVVFAPHQDDETLGCGGTITLKRRVGTPVTVVFMTDGSTSHRKFMPADQLRQLRKNEALEAGKVLGLDERDICFFDFPDGDLGSFHDAAVKETLAILQRGRPAEVFVPYRADRTPDHEATYRIVAEAVKLSGLDVGIYEYPVWLWNQWPWTRLELRPTRDTIRNIWELVRSGFGSKTFKEFESAVYVGDVLEAKREALAQHRSQMTELVPGVGWPTLREVAQGDFLSCFFQDFEIFRCSRSISSGNA